MLLRSQILTDILFRIYRLFYKSEKLTHKKIIGYNSLVTLWKDFVHYRIRKDEKFKI